MRLLLGSGPSPVPQRVLDALAEPTLGHLDPAFGEVMDDCARLLREVFRTQNPVTVPLSSTGSGGMQTMVDALCKPGDRVAVGVCGAFGARMADALGRAGVDVVRVEAEWGRAIEPERLVDAARGAHALFVVHGETSTGACQPLDGLAGSADLLLVDCVTSLGGQRIEIDAMGIDAAFSGSQKTLNVPPGLAPFTAGERAIERAQRRSWYFDLQAYVDYWTPGGDKARVYHHTAPTNMIVALREGLRIVAEEGLEARWERHARAHEALRRALAVVGLERIAPDGEQLHPLLAVRLPETIAPEDAALRRALLVEDGIEISGGLGPLAGAAWRIGVMGEGARPEPQERLVAAIARRIAPSSEAAALRELADGWAA